MKIWAHRGCSQAYPENTLLAFEKAVHIKKLTGIELDIQLTKDDCLVVMHDERVDRTTEGIGFVREYTLTELKKLHIYAGAYPVQTVPTMDEVFDLTEKSLRDGMKLNIELKTGTSAYPGIEEKIVELVHKRGIQSSVIYSSFYALSLEKIREFDPMSEIGVLDNRVSDCLYKALGLGANALHPFWKGMDLPAERFSGRPVRAWLSGHLYPEKPTGTRLDLEALSKQGVTDVFLNEPETYLQDGGEEQNDG